MATECVSHHHLHRDNSVLTSLLSHKAIPSYPYTPPDSENCIKKKEILQFNYHLCTTICSTPTYYYPAVVGPSITIASSICN